MMSMIGARMMAKNLDGLIANRKFKGVYGMNRNVLIDGQSRVINWDKLEKAVFRWMRFICGTSATVWLICQAGKGLVWWLGV